MALHLLVNFAGFNTIPCGHGGASNNPNAILTNLFGKNRQVTTRNVHSPVPNPSETESQVGSVNNHKIQAQDGGNKGVTEELQDSKIVAHDGQASDSQDHEIINSDLEKNKNGQQKNPSNSRNESNEMVLRSSVQT